MEWNSDSPEWERTRPPQVSLFRRLTGRYDTGWVSIDDLVPTARWFWVALIQHCEPGCCGLDAYSFTFDTVRWACGEDVTLPEGYLNSRIDSPGDPAALAAELRRTAIDVRNLEAKSVGAAIFGEDLIPESYASLFEDLARKLDRVEASRRQLD